MFKFLFLSQNFIFTSLAEYRRRLHWCYLKPSNRKVIFSSIEMWRKLTEILIKQWYSTTTRYMEDLGSQTTCLLINFLKNNIAKKSSFLDKNFYYEILCTDCFFELFISLIRPSKIMEGRHIAGKWMKYIREEHKFWLGKILRFMFSHCVFLCLFCFYRLKLWGNIAHRMSLKVLCVSGHSWSTLLGLK